MPRNLFFVRHGESEGNVANRASRRGDNSYFENQEFKKRHDSHWRLSKKGIEEARWAGAQLKALKLHFGRKYTSPYVRAMETMAEFSLGGVPAMVVYELRERSWGKLNKMPHEERVRQFGLSLEEREIDPYLWKPEGGEPLVWVQTRVRDILNTIWRECGDTNVVCVCHAEVIETVRVTVERKLPPEYIAMKKDPTQDIWNGSILHYTRIDPFPMEGYQGRESEYLAWVRLLTPPAAHEEGAIGFGWQKIQRAVLSDEELLKYVGKYPPICP